MPSFRSARIVRHAPEQMFDLVADTDRYPEFLPFCAGMKSRSCGEDDQGRPMILAEMQVGYKAIHERFVTKNTLDRGAMKIVVDYVEGPFSRLSNIWTFQPDPKGCRIEFFIDYEFRSRMLALLMGTMFDAVFRTFVGAFEARANKIYGRPGQ